MDDTTDLLGLLQLLKDNPVAFRSLNIIKIIRFSTLAARLKDDIILAQPPDHIASEPPLFLPRSIAMFLGAASGIPEDILPDCWRILRGTIWYEKDLLREDREASFRKHGYGLGLSAYCIFFVSCSANQLDTLASRTFYPPVHTCTSPHCKKQVAGIQLQKAQQRQVVFYTLDQGALPAYSVHLYCEGPCSPFLIG